MGPANALLLGFTCVAPVYGWIINEQKIQTAETPRRKGLPGAVLYPRFKNVLQAGCLTRCPMLKK